MAVQETPSDDSSPLEGIPAEASGSSHTIEHARQNQNIEAMREHEQQSYLFLQATLDALALHIAVLDERGTILTINGAWRRFAEENGADASTWMSCGVGANYLQVCDDAHGEGSVEAPLVAQGIREVVAGHRASFELEYPCSGPAQAQDRWFCLRVTAFDGELPVRVVVAHEDITARRQAEADSSFYATIAQSSEDAFISMAVDTTITHWNSGAEKMLGYTAAEIIGQPYACLVAPSQRQQFEASAARHLDEGRDVLLERTLLRKDGVQVEVSLRVNLVRDAQGQVLGRCAIACDISERKSAQQAIARLATIVESSDDAIISKTLQGIITTWNRGAERLYGYSAEEAIGQSMFMLMLPGRHSEEEAILERLSRGERIEQEEAERVCKDGRRLFISLSSSPLVDDTGRIVGASSIARDVTKQKRAAQEVEISLSLLQATLESTADSILVVDEAHRITHYNQRYLAMWGMDATCTGSAHMAKVEALSKIYMADPEAVVQSTRALYDNPEAEGMDVLHLRDGRVFERYSKPQRLDGRTVGRVWSFRDVTERHRAAQAQQQLNREMARQSQRLDEILSNVPGIVWESEVDASTCEQRTVYVSGYLRTMLGYSPDEWQSSPDFWLSVVHPDDKGSAREQVSAMLERKQDATLYYRLIARDGRVLWTESHYALALSEAERVTGIRGVTMDVTHRVLAQQEESRLAALLESTTDFVGWMSPQGSCQYINPAGRAMVGLDSETSVEGWPFTEFGPPWVNKIILGESLPAATQRGSWSGELAFLACDGHEIPVSQVISAHRDADGDVIFFSTIARDISERKRAEAELQRTNEELEQRVERRTQELAQSNIALQGEIVERHLAMGALKEVVTQLEVSKAQAEQANTELRANELHLIEGNRIFTELARLHASTQGELENVLSSITQASSEMLGVERCSVWRAEESQGEESIVCLDLYERSSGRHSRGARLLKRNYPAYFQALEAGVILAEDAHSHPATSEFSAGYLAPVGIGAMMDIAVANNGRLTGVVCYEHVGGPRQWKIEDQTFAASAAAIYTLAIEARERARTGEALRLAKEEAEQARQEAERANAAKSEFLSRMSHELRTPLNAILGFGQILELGELPPKKREGVGHILKAGEHLLNLINEVLDISRIEAGKMALSLEPVSLPATVHAVFDLARPLASAGNVQLIDEVQQHPWHLMADSQKLRQALLNLISNAIKYNSSGGSVSVSAQAVGEGQRLRISVRDTGLGLRAQDVTKLFTPFERLGAAQTRIEGTGIGLALTKRLVEIMGGDVGAASTWGDGSTFWIELPLVTSPLQAAQGQIEQEHAHPVARLPGKPKTILYIEDNLANLQLVAALLESVPGVRLLTATQGSTGLDMAFEHGPDLIILDLHLPDINGDRVLERLQSNALTGHIPVIMLSADATQGQIERLLAAGARTYITKPLNVKQFLRSVEENLHEL